MIPQNKGISFVTVMALVGAIGALGVLYWTGSGGALVAYGGAIIAVGEGFHAITQRLDALIANTTR